MKKLTILALALLLAGTAAAQWGRRIKGNGKMTTEERSTGDYDGVAVAGFFDVDLVAGNEGNVTVEAEENLLEYIVTEVKNGTLHIKVEKGVNIRPSNWSHGVRVTVPVEEVEEVSLSGSGDIVGKTTLRASNFSTSMAGSGDITLDVEASNMDVSMSGSGDINLSGRANQLSVQISGSGDVKAYDLEADMVEASISGSADIRVTANESLIARVSGSGDIHYRGNPAKIVSKASGSGDITKG